MSKNFQLVPIFVVLFACAPENQEDSPEQRPLNMDIEATELLRGDTGEFIWTQARAAALPGGGAVMTMSKKLLTGEDVYYDLYQCVLQRDQWSDPQVIPSLKIHEIENGYRRSMSDMTPMWHPQSGKVINIGKSFFYSNDEDPDRSRREIAYSYYDPKTNQWGPFKAMNMPETDNQGNFIMASTAGCVQFHIEPNGKIYLPVFFYNLSQEQMGQVSRETFTVRNLMQSDDIGSSVAMVRCSFDGENLLFEEMGNTLTLKQGRGLGEPSVIKYRNNWYLTLRSDKSAYVASSEDGLNFSEPKEWRFDNDSILGSYNTQQHWANVGDQLYLIYTRPDGNNNHIFRHRAPLYIGKVDHENLVVMKSTERVCIPEDGVALGNFGVTYVNENESWIITAEYLRNNSTGKTNRVFMARLTSQPVLGQYLVF